MLPTTKIPTITLLYIMQKPKKKPAQQAGFFYKWLFNNYASHIAICLFTFGANTTVSNWFFFQNDDMFWSLSNSYKNIAAFWYKNLHFSFNTFSFYLGMLLIERFMACCIIFLFSFLHNEMQCFVFLNNLIIFANYINQFTKKSIKNFT